MKKTAELVTIKRSFRAHRSELVIASRRRANIEKETKSKEKEKKEIR
jgi:hypothetical protein